MRSMEHYFDDHGYIVTMPDKDGSNTFYNHGVYRFARYLKFKDSPDRLSRELAKYEQEADGLENPNEPHEYYKHPTIKKPVSSLEKLPGIVAMGALKLDKRLLGIIFKNPFQNLKENIRAINMLGSRYKLAILLYAVLLFLDLFSLINLLYNFKKIKASSYLETNTIVSLIQARISLPTPFSWLSRKFYINNRAIYDFGWPVEPILSTNPPIHDAYQEILKKYMGD